jgi:hypothetical protein
VNLPEGLIALLRQPSLCFLTTLMPDGSPQMTQTWVDTDGEHVVISPDGKVLATGDDLDADQPTSTPARTYLWDVSGLP